MTDKEKVQYMDIALRMAGFCFKPEAVALIVDLYDYIRKKKGSSDIGNIGRIIAKHNGGEFPQIDVTAAPVGEISTA